MKRRPYLYFLCNTTAITVQGGTVRHPFFFYDFTTLAWNNCRLNYSRMVSRPWKLWKFCPAINLSTYGILPTYPRIYTGMFNNVWVHICIQKLQYTWKEKLKIYLPQHKLQWEHVHIIRSICMQWVWEGNIGSYVRGYPSTYVTSATHPEPTRDKIGRTSVNSFIVGNNSLTHRPCLMQEAILLLHNHRGFSTEYIVWVWGYIWTWVPLANHVTS